LAGGNGVGGRALLDELDLSAEAKVMRLDVEKWPDRGGGVSPSFRTAQSFRVLRPGRTVT
jgi:hypothetical protein